MNYNLTDKQEDRVYKNIINIFEKVHGKVTNCESNYITDNRNYFFIHNSSNEFKVTFNTKKGKLLKRSVKIIKYV